MGTTTLTERDRYRELHEHNKHYQTNNWLMDEWEFLTDRLSGSIVEIGCGNGRFLVKAGEHFTRAIGVDWVAAPGIRQALDSGAHIEFIEADLTKNALDVRADACVSADVLEHIAPESIHWVIGRMNDVAPAQFHKIACYPDEWRHPSVFSADEWLAHFQRSDPAFRILKTEHRRGKEDQPVVTIVRGIA